MRLSLLAPALALAASQFALASTASAQVADQSNVQQTAAPQAPAAPEDPAAPAPPAAAAWKYVQLGDGATLAWLAKARPGKKEGSLRALRFIHPKEPKLFERKRVAFMYDEFEIDCANNKFQVLRGLLLDKDAENVGKTDGSMSPQPIADKSPEFILKKIYCENLNFAQAKEAANLDAAIFAVGGVAPKHD